MSTTDASIRVAFQLWERTGSNLLQTAFLQARLEASSLTALVDSRYIEALDTYRMLMHQGLRILVQGYCWYDMLRGRSL